ncbi:hypothetical protein HK405_002250, partial [Cladochytrium tenue]
MTSQTPVTLYASRTSSASRRVRAALLYKGVAFEESGVDLDTGEHRRPEFRRVNPLGVVPALAVVADGGADGGPSEQVFLSQ